MKIGCFLSSEECGPLELVARAKRAEAAGFHALWISDHYHPWIDEQGHSPFVWSVIGAIAATTDLPVTTGVTCPTLRIHPAVVAHAAATSAVMLDGRFVLGVGSGEALNEHILGDAWPPAEIRLEMLEEAVEVMRRLWSEDGFVTHRGRYYTVDNARLYTRPDVPPQVYVSGFGPAATKLAARIGDGYVTTSPDTELLGLFREESGGKPAQAGVKVAWAPTQDEGVGHAHRLWANSGLPGEMAQILPSPRHFEQASQLVTEESTRESVSAGPDLDAHREALQPYVDAGFEELYLGNIGPHTLDMLEVFGREVLPGLR